MNRHVMTVGSVIMLVAALFYARSVHSNEPSDEPAPQTDVETQRELPALSEKQRQLKALEAQRDVLREAVGNNHPQVLEIERDIAEFVGDDPLLRLDTTDLQEMSDEQLRDTIAVLIVRVLELEATVAELNDPGPKFRLLQ